ncbi:MAG TPA: MFS transporter [Propionicimonas sp.]|nr:MFS transporter [Propionicimonas sp.]
MFRLPRHRPSLTRARYLLLAMFGLTGLVSFSWLARLPAIRDSLGMGTAELGLVLLLGSLGALVTVIAAPALVRRLGTPAVFLASSVLISAGIVGMSCAIPFGSRWWLVGGMAVQGMGAALGTVVINVESARIERALGRSVIAHFHAAFSAGAVLGSLLGALCSWLGVPVAVQFQAVAVVALGLRLAAVAGGLVLPQRPDEVALPQTAGRPSVRAWREPRTLLIGAIVAAVVVSEGAANNWVSVAVVDGFDQVEAVGGAVLGVFIASMLVVRAVGPRLVDRFGRVVALRAAITASALGVGLFGLAPGLGGAVAGAALWGVGAALCFPICVSAVSDQPLGSAARVGVLSASATVAGLVAPPALGLVAGAVGVRVALLAVAVALVASLAATGRVAPYRSRDAGVREVSPEPVASTA